MSAVIVRLLPADEQALLKCYVEGTTEPENAKAFYDATGVPTDAEPTRLAIAVAQILLHHIQEALPQWASVSSDRVSVSRLAHRRHQDARLIFSPRLVCTINWADSGPGFSWPEAYYVTYLPGFDKFVVTASRDGPDMLGCEDHAIGVADGSLSPADAAKKVIIEYWRSQSASADQERWAYLFDEGLIDDQTAHAWADEIWPGENDENDDEELDDAQQS